MRGNHLKKWPAAADRVRRLRKEEASRPDDLMTGHFLQQLKPTTREAVLAERSSTYWDLVKYMAAKQWPANRGE